MNHLCDNFSRLHPNALNRDVKPSKTRFKTERNRLLLREFVEPSLASHAPLPSERDVRAQELRAMLDDTLDSMQRRVNTLYMMDSMLRKAGR